MVFQDEHFLPFLADDFGLADLFDQLLLFFLGVPAEQDLVGHQVVLLEYFSEQLEIDALYLPFPFNTQSLLHSYLVISLFFRSLPTDSCFVLLSEPVSCAFLGFGLFGLVAGLVSWRIWPFGRGGLFEFGRLAGFFEFGWFLDFLEF